MPQHAQNQEDRSTSSSEEANLKRQSATEEAELGGIESLEKRIMAIQGKIANESNATTRAKSIRKSHDRLLSKSMLDQSSSHRIDIRSDIRSAARTTVTKMKRRSYAESVLKRRLTDNDILLQDEVEICKRSKSDGGNHFKNEEEIESFIGDVEAPMQSLVRDEESVSENKTVCLDNVFDGLQRFKEENGNLLVPISHPVLSMIDKLSSRDVEPPERRRRKAIGGPHAGGQMQIQETEQIRDAIQRMAESEQSINSISVSSNETTPSDADLLTRSLEEFGSVSSNERMPGEVDTLRQGLEEFGSVSSNDRMQSDADIVRESLEELGSLLVTPSPPVPPQFFSAEEEDDTMAAKILRASQKPDDASVGSTETNVANDLRSPQEGTDGQNNGDTGVEEIRPLPSSHNVRFQPSPVEQATGGQALGQSSIQSQRRQQRRTFLSALPPVFQRQLNRNSDSTDERGGSIPNMLSRITNVLSRGISTAGLFGDAVTADSEVLVSATLVQEAEVVMAEPVGFIESKWHFFVPSMCIMLALFTLLLTLSLTGVIGNHGRENQLEISEPSLSPTFDPGPTLEIVQKRGHVVCGLGSSVISSGKGSSLDLCRSVAAVVVGNPDSFESVPTTSSNRWKHLLDRTVDLVILGDTYTIEREIRERSTGAGFTFSSVYAYSGMVYAGNQTFVHCAEEFKSYDECSSLKICAQTSSTHYDFVRTKFPSDYSKGVSSMEQMGEMLFNGTCNVIASEKSFLLQNPSLKDAIRDKKILLSDKMITKEPHSVVTRNTDRQFSDIINWVINVLIYGEEKGLVKDASICSSTELDSADISELNFLNAVYCVGNYGEIFYDLGGDSGDKGMNQINNGTGMLYAIPFGNIDRDDNIIEPAANSILTKIKNEGSLNCGVVIPERAPESDKLVSLGFDYCRVLSAALLVGDSEDVNFFNYSENDNSSFIALADEEIDVLVGSREQHQYDFEMTSSQAGFDFSTPYYYGNEAAIYGVSVYSIATRENDVLFSSFVNCIVLATIFAQENGIQMEEREKMPLSSIFGSNLKWALKDAFAFSGNYDQIYSKHFGSNVTESDKGRNTLNEGGPLLISFLQLP